MTNRQLVDVIRAGKATDGQRKEYGRRVRRLAEPHPCTHGHFDCALVEKGPCLDETLAACADGGWDAD